MSEAIGHLGWSPFWPDGRDSRARGWFVVGSVLLHLLLAWLLVKGLPSWFETPRHDPAAPPLTVTLLDPDAINELPVGPTTHLPPRFRNLEAAPLRRLAPAPAVRPAAPPASTETTGLERNPAAHGAPAIPSPPAAGREPSSDATANRAPAPPSAGSIPGLPFVNQDELNQTVAKLYSDQPKSKEPYQVNTEDLQYLSYIAQIARTLELIWKYPKAAGDLGQQGVTVLKITILDDGTLESAELLESSGYAMLDGEALRAVKRLTPYPPLPKNWHRSQWDLTISFRYVLNGVAVNVI